MAGEKFVSQWEITGAGAAVARDRIQG